MGNLTRNCWVRRIGAFAASDYFALGLASGLRAQAAKKTPEGMRRRRRGSSLRRARA